MIGVVTRAEERDIAREFFELFKTPWEFCRADSRYEVVIDASACVNHHAAKLVIAYGSQAAASDRERKHVPGPEQRNATLSYNDDRIKLYGRCVTFPSDSLSPQLVLEKTQEPVVSVTHTDGSTFVRIGYDLFWEVGFLLTTGQPAAHAGIPTLERHIAFLRDCIVGAGIPLVEIPPVPAGYRFIVCLTHDVDHPSIRLHKFDHTMAGFLYRAVVGSLVGAWTRRLPPAALRRNLTAALLLPFVHLGWAKDFWSGFDQYLEIEKGLGSTFFVIPFKNRPGRTVEGEAPRRRASSYGVSDIAPQVTTVTAGGGEVALHGIDAWIDSTAGSEERGVVSRVTGMSTAGARMHWLYWDERAPQRLEEAGFDYDSTFGYNDTVGFRAGTAQAFKPITARHLLEMPLTIMDTALFYPSYLNLTREEAKDKLRSLVDDLERYGGALTINWHDRSLAPERLWGGFYTELVDDLKRRTAWFPSVAQAAAWFRRRRSVVFNSVRWDGDSVHVTASAECGVDLPGLSVRIHMPGFLSDERVQPRPERFVDVPFRKVVVDAHARL
jgi:hypothetical protein